MENGLRGVYGTIVSAEVTMEDCHKVWKRELKAHWKAEQLRNTGQEFVFDHEVHC